MPNCRPGCGRCRNRQNFGQPPGCGRAIFAADNPERRAAECGPPTGNIRNADSTKLFGFADEATCYSARRDLYSDPNSSGNPLELCCDYGGCQAYPARDRNPYWPGFCHPRWLPCALLYSTSCTDIRDLPV